MYQKIQVCDMIGYLKFFTRMKKKLPVGIKIPIGFEQNFHTVSNSDRKP